MKIMEMVGKVVALPIRIVDLPFRCMKELVDDPEPEEGA